MPNLLLLLTCVAATYAITRYATQEAGPLNILGRLRTRVGSLGQGFKDWVACPFCFLVTAAVVAYVLSLTVYTRWLVELLAVIGGAVFLLDVVMVLRNVAQRMTDYIRVYAIAFEVKHDFKDGQFTFGLPKELQLNADESGADK